VTTAVRRRAPLVAYLIASIVSISGTRVSAIAIPWLVLTTTGSAAKTGLVVVFELTPLVITKALGGPLIDRIGGRRVSIVADLASTVVVAAIPLLHLVDLLSFPALLVLVALAGMLRGPGDTAKHILMPDVAEAARVPIERVTGLYSTADRGAMIVAPAVAGVVIGAIGPVMALVVDAASFVVAAALIAAFIPRLTAKPDAEPESYAVRLRAGWRFLSREPLLRAIVVMVCVTNLLDIAYHSVLLPVWIRDNGYGPAEIGLLGSTFGITAMAGSLVAAAVGDRLPRRTVYLVGFLIGGAPRIVVLAFGVPLWVVVAVSLAGGFGSGFLNPIIGAIFFDRTPQQQRGRVFSLGDSLAWAGMPLGGVLAGVAVAAIGLNPVLLITGGIYFVVTTAPALLSQWKEMDSRRSDAADEPVPRREVPAG
jgi:MFS family permease